MCVYMYIYIYIYTHTYTYIHCLTEFVKGLVKGCGGSLHTNQKSSLHVRAASSSAAAGCGEPGS